MKKRISKLKKSVSNDKSPYEKITNTSICEWENNSDKTINQLFEEQVEKTPDLIAAVFEGNKLSYRELNSQANQFARHIRKIFKISHQQDQLSDKLIGICLDRNLDMIIAILGVLKAGAAYVPIDPSHPIERIKYILNDCRRPILLTSTCLKNKLIYVVDETDLTSKSCTTMSVFSKIALQFILLY